MSSKALRPAPAESATKFKVGTIKKGGDGNRWRIIVTSTGIKRWQKIQRLSASVSPRSTSNAKRSPKQKHTTHSTKNNKLKTHGDHIIKLCEPTGLLSSHQSFASIASSSITSIIFKVSDKMYKKLCDKPIKKTGKNYGNSYIFGKQFPLDSYKQLGDIDNDAAQVGFFDVSDMTSDEYDEIKEKFNLYSKRIDAFQKAHSYNWNHPTLLKFIKEKITKRIIFLGNTVGGDVGAAVFVHHQNKEIDGLIIDVSNYTFHLEA